MLVPWGVQHYSSGTAQAVLDYASPGARLIFSCGWHITRDGKDVIEKKYGNLLQMYEKINDEETSKIQIMIYTEVE